MYISHYTHINLCICLFKLYVYTHVLKYSTDIYKYTHTQTFIENKKHVVPE